jgi:hypothetical protein
MQLAQDRMAVFASIHHRDITYNIGDMVYISTKTVRAGTKIAKFKVRWIGPYKILEKRNPVAYKVDIPYEMVVNKVYPVYHVNKLNGTAELLDRRTSRLGIGVQSAKYSKQQSARGLQNYAIGYPVALPPPKNENGDQ